MTKFYDSRITLARITLARIKLARIKLARIKPAAIFLFEPVTYPFASIPKLPGILYPRCNCAS